MIIKQFFAYLWSLFEEQAFDALLKHPAFQDSGASEYLRSRGITPELAEFAGCEIAVFEGDFKYQQKNYKLAKSVVVALRDPFTKILKGVWIRAIEQKQFYIWLCENHQKYWVGSTINLREPIVVCESIFDALSLQALSRNQNVVAALGVSITNDLMDLIARTNQPAILAFDNDRAGRSSMLGLLEKNPTWSIIQAEVADGEQFKDFNEILMSKLSNASNASNEPVALKTYGQILAKVKLRSSL